MPISTTTWYDGARQATGADLADEQFTIIDNPLYESSEDLQRQLATPEHFNHLHETGRREPQNVYGAASRSRLDDLALVLGGGRRPSIQPPIYEEIDLPATSPSARSGSNYEEIDPPAATAARYANKPLPSLPAVKPDLKADYETVSPPKPLRARDEEPISSGARTPPPTPPKPSKPGAHHYFELELQTERQTETRKSPPPTPPKPGSPVSSRSPSPDTRAPFAAGGPQLGAGIATAAAAMARQRAGH